MKEQALLPLHIPIVGLLPLHYIFYLGQCLDGYFLDFGLASRSTTVAAVAHRPHTPHDFIFRIICDTHDGIVCKTASGNYLWGTVTIEDRLCRHTVR
jgi:hypothetical protein